MIEQAVPDEGTFGKAVQEQQHGPAALTSRVAVQAGAVGQGDIDTSAHDAIKIIAASALFVSASGLFQCKPLRLPMR